MNLILILACALDPNHGDPVVVDTDAECDVPVCEGGEVLYRENHGDNGDFDTICVWSCASTIEGGPTTGIVLELTSDGTCDVQFYDADCGGAR